MPSSSDVVEMGRTLWLVLPLGGPLGDRCCIWAAASASKLSWDVAALSPSAATRQAALGSGAADSGVLTAEPAALTSRDMPGAWEPASVSVCVFVACVGASGLATYTVLVGGVGGAKPDDAARAAAGSTSSGLPRLSQWYTKVEGNQPDLRCLALERTVSPSASKMTSK